MREFYEFFLIQGERQVTGSVFKIKNKPFSVIENWVLIIVNWLLLIDNEQKTAYFSRKIAILGLFLD